MRAYIVIALVIVGMIGSWWLAQKPDVAPPATSTAVIDQQGATAIGDKSDLQKVWSQSYTSANIDFALFDFNAKQFDANGKLQHQLAGSKMLHLSPSEQAGKLPQLRYVISRPQGTWLGKSARSISAMRALADAKFATIDWHHQVTLKQPREHLTLRADNLLQTPQHFSATGKVEAANDAGKVQAEQLDFDPQQQILNFTGAVHSEYLP